MANNFWRVAPRNHATAQAHSQPSASGRPKGWRELRGLRPHCSPKAYHKMHHKCHKCSPAHKRAEEHPACLLCLSACLLRALLPVCCACMCLPACLHCLHACLHLPASMSALLPAYQFARLKSGCCTSMHVKCSLRKGCSRLAPPSLFWFALASPCLSMADPDLVRLLNLGCLDFGWA